MMIRRNAAISTVDYDGSVENAGHRRNLPCGSPRLQKVKEIWDKAKKPAWFASKFMEITVPFVKRLIKHVE